MTDIEAGAQRILCFATISPLDFGDPLEWHLHQILPKVEQATASAYVTGHKLRSRK